MKLLVLKIEDIRDLPREYTDATTVSAVDDFSDKIKTLSHDIVKCLHDKHPSKKSKIKFHKTKANIDVAKVICCFVNFFFLSLHIFLFCFLFNLGKYSQLEIERLVKGWGRKAMGLIKIFNL